MDSDDYRLFPYADESSGHEHEGMSYALAAKLQNHHNTDIDLATANTSNVSDHTNLITPSTPTQLEHKGPELLSAKLG